MEKKERKKRGRRLEEKREEKRERRMNIVCTVCSHSRENMQKQYDGEGSNLDLCIAKVEIDGLGMADVKDAIRLRRKPGHHLLEEKSKIKATGSVSIRLERHKSVPQVALFPSH